MFSEGEQGDDKGIGAGIGVGVGAGIGYILIPTPLSPGGERGRGIGAVGAGINKIINMNLERNWLL